MMTKIVKCACKNDYQDSKYGKGNRVANKTTSSKGTTPTFRCTVCLKEH